MNSPRSNGFAPIDRRRFLAGEAGAAAIAAAAPSGRLSAADTYSPLQGPHRAGGPRALGKKKMTLEQMSRCASRAHGMGFVAPADWPTLKKYGLLSPIVQGHSLEKALNRRENHGECLAAIRKSIGRRPPGCPP